PRAEPGDRFGTAIALRGDVLLVGAPFDDFNDTDTGAAFLFQASTGVLLAILENPSPEIGDQFGAAVALGVGVAVVGDFLDARDARGSGTASVFVDEGAPTTTTTSTTSTTSLSTTSTSTTSSSSTSTTSSTSTSTTATTPDASSTTTTTTAPDASTTTSS